MLWRGGEPMIRLMNKVGYDVVTMGNHDFDYGQKILKKRLHEANFPVVCANMLSEKSELGQLPAYQMIERGGLIFLSVISRTLFRNINGWRRNVT